MRPRRFLPLLGTLVAALALWLGGAAPALAHASLVGSSPADGSRVATSPTAVTLTFDEPVQLVRGSAHVLDGHLRIVNQPAAAAAAGSVVRVPLTHPLATGAYIVVWQVISADGHTVSGSIRFGVRAAPDAATAAPTAAPITAADHVHDILTGLANAAAVLVIGVPLAALLLTRRRPRARALPLILLGAVFELVISLGLLFVDAARASGGSVVSTAPFHAAQLANHGQQMLWLRILGALALSALLLASKRLGQRIGERRTSLVLGVPLLVLVLAHAWDGHASVGSWQVVAVAAAMLHLAAVTAWIGGLLLLLTRLVPVAENPGTAARWSLIAGSCVATIAVTGVVQAVRQVSPLASLWSTEYGVLVLAKVALLASVVCVAFFLRRRLLRKQMLATGLLGVELAVLVVVLGVTGVLQSRTPAHDDYGPPLVAHAPLGADDLRVTLSTTRPGPVTVRVSRRHGASPAGLENLNGTLVGNVEGPVTLPLSFRRDSDGSWSARGNLPTAGSWRLQFNAQLSADLAYATTVTFRVW